MAPLGLPVWGTPDSAKETLEVVEYTVVGFYGYDGTRFATQFPASSPRAAEDGVMDEFGKQKAADGSPCDLQIAGVLAIENGVIVRCDEGYATFLDPDRRPEN